MIMLYKPLKYGIFATGDEHTNKRLRKQGYNSVYSKIIIHNRKKSLFATNVGPFGERTSDGGNGNHSVSLPMIFGLNIFHSN